jgi:quercetin dioxygenase-like cupin family protein
MATEPFARTKLQEHLTVKELISFHYFEFSKDYIFEGEKHNFWEILYVDKGEMEVFADTEGYRLKQGDILFHKPNEFHSIWANKRIAPNVIVLSFVCRSRAMNFFKDKLFHLSEFQQGHLAQIMKYGFAAFLPPYDDPKNHTLVRRKGVAHGTEQLLKLHLELLLIELLHSGDPARKEQRISGATKSRSEEDLVKRMCQYMELHLYSSIQLEQIYKTFNLSRSHTLKLFKDRTGQPL